MSVNTESVQNTTVQAPGPIAGPLSVQGNGVPAELEPHLHRLGLTGSVQAVVDAVRQVYRDAERIELSIFREEYGEECVRVNAIVPDEGDAEAEMYFRCLSLWTGAIDPNAAGKIRFSTS
jgi:hypothetical protein